METERCVFVSAGEVSGDWHAAHLVKALKTKGVCDFAGMGGSHLSAEGVEIVANVIHQSTIGFLEPIRHLGTFYRVFRMLKRWLRINRPTVFIAVDFQGFNVALCRYAKSIGIPVVYYIAPQEWQWGTESGGKKVIAATDLILSIFEPEHAFYNRLGGNSVFIGHPLRDIVPTLAERVPKAPYTLGVFPGSRQQEIQHMFPVFIETIDRLQRRYSGLKVLISIATPELKAAIQGGVEQRHIQNIEWVESDPYRVMAESDISLVTSGTVTLEHAIANRPAVVGYRLHPISYQVARWIMGKKFAQRVRFIALPNIYLKQKAMPEFLQNECTADALYQSCCELLESQSNRAAILSAFESVRHLLGPPGAVDRAATEIVSRWPVCMIKNGGSDERY